MDALEGRSRQFPRTHSGIALGRITYVYPDQRFCEVKTFFGEDDLNDKHISRCQWLSVDANPDGDENTCIPRVGATGLVFFVNGLAFIWGYFRTTDHKNGAGNAQSPTRLTEGDKIISTVAGNFIVVKSNGVVEIHSSDTLRTIYFPKEGRLAQLCEAYEMTGNWGYTKAEVVDDDTNETLHISEYRRDMARTSVIIEEKGKVDSKVIHRVTMGPALPGQEEISVPLFKYTMDVTGEMNYEVGIAGTGPSWKVSPLGDALFKNNFGSISLSAKGDWEIKTPVATFTLAATGDMSAKNAVATLSASAEGDIEVGNGVSNAAMAVSGDIKISNPITSAEFLKDGTTTIKNAVGILKMDKTGKFGIGGPAAELLDLIDQTLDAFINQTNLTMTGVGPSSGLLPPAMTNLVKIKALLGAIKGSV